MRSIETTPLKMMCIAIILSIFAALPAYGQNARLQIDSLDKLARDAVETVDITVDEALLKLTARFLTDDDPDDREVRDLINGLKGVYVKSFEFEKEGMYSPADLEGIRAQLRAPGWSRIVGAVSKREGDNVEVYTLTQGGGIVGLAILSANPKELTVVNIVGPINLDRLSELDGKFGIPPIKLERRDKPRGN